MRGGPTYDQERVSFNVARLRKGGEVFEIVVDPDAAVTMKEGGSDAVSDVVKAEKVFSDAKKGLLASEEHMKSVFGTSDFASVAKHILAEGEIQLTAEHREAVRERKRKKLIALIHRNAVDPKTGNPHPEKRIELAFEEAKVRIDEFKTADQQLDEVVKKLQAILPLKFEKAHLLVSVGSQYAGKMFGEVSRMARILKDSWRNDGGWQAEVELPGGLRDEFIDMLNGLTHGSAHVEELKK
ncbi:ribosome assembly factor SBDS [Candidatus Woesearchaeota archaeon]|nr:MAG: ribosome assembly factor SBDS [Candidatus Woesearchaeota archaeon]